jgi:hypothetical protein
MKTLRERNRFHGEPKEETLEGERYRLRYQAVDDKSHPDEVKPRGATFPILVEVFDGEELTYQQIYGVHDDHERREVLEMTRRQIKSGEHASRKRSA